MRKSDVNSYRLVTVIFCFHKYFTSVNRFPNEITWTEQFQRTECDIDINGWYKKKFGYNNKMPIKNNYYVSDQ